MPHTHVTITPPEAQRAVRLSDGRHLAWSEWGPGEGYPVLFATGAAMTGELGFGADVLGKLGLRLIAIDRPGLGRSDPHPSKTLSTWADDVGELIRAERLPAPLAVGFSQGAPFALALAARHLVRAVAIVAGQDQLAHPLILPRLHPDIAAMVAAVGASPAQFERNIAQTGRAEAMWHLVMAMSSERDRSVYRNESFAHAYTQTLWQGFAQGAGGYARDLVNALGPWPFEVEQIDTPVDLWYGGQDTSPVHSPDFGSTLAARLPNASHTIDPGEGGSILWTRASEILTHLSAHVTR